MSVNTKEVEGWDDLKTRGDWMKVRGGIILVCSKCGQYFSLTTVHTFQYTEGRLTVSPSIVCPHPGCGAHYFIKDGVAEGVGVSL